MLIREGWTVHMLSGTQLDCVRLSPVQVEFCEVAVVPLPPPAQHLHSTKTTVKYRTVIKIQHQAYGPTTLGS